jgi:hypothetical protein
VELPVKRRAFKQLATTGRNSLKLVNSGSVLYGGGIMSDRHEIIDDKEFWTRLEYDASRWLEGLEDKTLRGLWIDGFLPDGIKDTKHGIDVEGTAWVGDGPRKQNQYRFVVSIPQRMIHHHRETYTISQLVLSEAQQTLQIEIA